jgi:hypothetical protein
MLLNVSHGHLLTKLSRVQKAFGSQLQVPIAGSGGTEVT